MNYTVFAPQKSELDLSDVDSIDNYFRNNGTDFDVVIYCAGRNNPNSIEDTNFTDHLLTQNVNINSFYKVMQNIIPSLKKQKSGYVLGISSLYGSVSRDQRSSYAMSKHSMNGFIQTLALELGSYNVLSNTLSPGFVDTKMTRQNNSEDQIKMLKSKVPLGKFASPEDIAEVAYFLCSKNNKYISGQDIVVDGGFMAGGFCK
jgi:3-oxoacyl-[acyl-carrier protein] reductase